MENLFQTITVNTAKRNQMIDITAEVEIVIAESGTDTGLVTVFCPHTTAGITITENADPDVVHDMLKTFERLVPQDPSYRHIEGNSDSHVKSSLVGVSETICIQNGKMRLGTWQGIYFCEFDGPRTRNIHILVIR